MPAPLFDPSKPGTLTRTCLNKLLKSGDAFEISQLPPTIIQHFVILLQQELEQSRQVHKTVGKRHYQVDWRQLHSNKPVSLAHVREIRQAVREALDLTQWTVHDVVAERTAEAIRDRIIDEERPLREKVIKLKKWYMDATSSQVRNAYTVILVSYALCYWILLILVYELVTFVYEMLAGQKADFITLEEASDMLPLPCLLFFFLVGIASAGRSFASTTWFSGVLWLLTLLVCGVGADSNYIQRWGIASIAHFAVRFFPDSFIAAGRLIGLESCLHFDRKFASTAVGHLPRLERLQPGDRIVQSAFPKNPSWRYWAQVGHFCIRDGIGVRVCNPGIHVLAMREGEYTTEDWFREHAAREGHHFWDREISPDECLARLSLLFDLPEFIQRPWLVRLIHEDGSEVEISQRKAVFEDVTDDDDGEIDIAARDRVGINFVGQPETSLKPVVDLLSVILRPQLDGLTR